MDCYAKQGYPDGFDRNGTSYPWEPAMGFDMSMSPGTVIRPDMPLGSGPARTNDPVPAPIPMSRQDISVGPCSWNQRPCCNVSDSNANNCTMKCPERPSCVMPAREMPTKCPERPSCVMPAKCVERPTCVMPAREMPAKCPEIPSCEMPARWPEKPNSVMPD